MSKLYTFSSCLPTSWFPRVYQTRHHPAIPILPRFLQRQLQHTSDQQSLQDVPSLRFSLTGVTTAAKTLPTPHAVAFDDFRLLVGLILLYLPSVTWSLFFRRSVSSVSYTHFLDSPADFFSLFPLAPSSIRPLFPSVFHLRFYLIDF